MKGVSKTFILIHPRTKAAYVHPKLANGDFTSALRRKYTSADPLLDDIAVGKRLSRSWPTHSAFLSTVDSEGIAGMLYPHINSHILIFLLRETPSSIIFV